ncbi:MAG: hypothetical protein BEN19_05665 [Epulopiscium sp. Nuni2H_MBin003]|nr:MAG: hypothetical protein BEN19_05665 [Epulopiscium sp. Nuni2H_MBin003]
MIHQVDTFVFLEDVQYTKRDWRNRNKILINGTPKWITVPIKQLAFEQKICDTNIFTIENWQQKHYKMLQSAYSKSPYYKEYKLMLDDIYIKKEWISLSELNIYSTKLICNELGINTKFINSADLKTTGTKDDKLIDICNRLGATHYLSGPSAKNYIDPNKFIKNNIILEYIEYDYPPYLQYKGEFITHNVSILDVLFNCGKDTPKYIWR